MARPAELQANPALSNLPCMKTASNQRSDRTSSSGRCRSIRTGDPVAANFGDAQGLPPAVPVAPVSGRGTCYRAVPLGKTAAVADKVSPVPLCQRQGR